MSVIDFAALQSLLFVNDF